MVSGTLENRLRRDAVSFSRCGLVKTSVCFFVHLIITKILEPINLFQLFRCNRHRWLIMASVHYGLKRGTPTYACVCVCVFTIGIHSGDMKWLLLCQRVPKRGGTVSTDVSVFERFEVREPLTRKKKKRKAEEKIYSDESAQLLRRQNRRRRTSSRGRSRK